AGQTRRHVDLGADAIRFDAEHCSGLNLREHAARLQHVACRSSCTRSRAVASRSRRGQEEVATGLRILSGGPDIDLRKNRAGARNLVARNPACGVLCHAAMHADRLKAILRRRLRRDGRACGANWLWLVLLAMSIALATLYVASEGRA